MQTIAGKSQWPLNFTWGKKNTLPLPPPPTHTPETCQYIGLPTLRMGLPMLWVPPPQQSRIDPTDNHPNNVWGLSGVFCGGVGVSEKLWCDEKFEISGWIPRNCYKIFIFSIGCDKIPPLLDQKKAIFTPPHTHTYTHPTHHLNTNISETRLNLEFFYFYPSNVTELFKNHLALTEFYRQISPFSKVSVGFVRIG